MSEPCLSCMSTDTFTSLDSKNNNWLYCNHCGYNEIISLTATEFVTNGTKIDSLRIKECIVSFKEKFNEFPKSDDVVKVFTANFGSVNGESLAREMRRLAEEGILKRTEDHRYYFDGLGSNPNP